MSMYPTSRFDTWERKPPSRPRDVLLPLPAKTSSFSSSLLDSIYRTIDDDHHLFASAAAGRRKPAALNTIREDNATGFRRSAVAEKWLQRYQARNPASSSSDSSTGGGGSSSSRTSALFSSSESEYGAAGCRSRPPSIRYATGRGETPPVLLQKQEKQEKNKQWKEGVESTVGGLTRTKSRTMKVYDQLKKAKYPISPGRRISSFLNYLFHSASPRHRRTAAFTTTPTAEALTPIIKTKPPSTTISIPVAAGCLSKTPGGGRGRADGMKRSVRFSGEGVGEEKKASSSPPCVAAKGRRSSAGGRKWAEEEEEEEGEESESEDDRYSCGSSDLFELENLIGMGGRYREELPVHETTTTTATTKTTAKRSLHE